ncbi:MAG: lysophospholipid acyltransferase family protein [Sphingomicrobium sp.]
MALPATAAAEPGSSRWRAALRISGLLLLLLAMVPPHLIAKLGGRRSPWPQRFLGQAARIIGVRATIEGAPLTPPTLAIANHTSWLDILILGGATGTAFVSKADIASAPLVGWLADQNHTLYIERSDRSDAHGQVRRIAEGIERAQPLTVFPEGTTGDGRALLPFRSTLLAAVTPAAPGTAVRPIAIDYGAAGPGIAWHGGERAIDNALRILGRRGTLPVTIRLLAALPPGEDRKTLARAAQAAIGAALTSAPLPTRL